MLRQLTQFGSRWGVQVAPGAGRPQDTRVGCYLQHGTEDAVEGRVPECDPAQGLPRRPLEQRRIG